LRCLLINFNIYVTYLRLFELLQIFMPGVDMQFQHSKSSTRPEVPSHQISLYEFKRNAESFVNVDCAEEGLVTVSEALQDEKARKQCYKQAQSSYQK
jgi:hypothetical protein